jgi:excisionase family DNA binding protein
MQNNEFDQYFSIAEVGRILGWERSTVYSRIKQKRLAAIRLDGSVKIPRSELLKYLATATPVSA